MPKPRLVYVVTHPVTANSFLRGQLTFMREAGFDVSVIASPGKDLEEVRDRECVRVLAVPMQRRIDPRADAMALARLTKVLRELEPDIVQASTPKAGLLGMLAARTLRVPFRTYLLRGLRLETTTGTLRRVLSVTERIASHCAHDVVCNSASLRAAAVSGGHIPESRSCVVGAGSSNGVDVARWELTPARMEEARSLARSVGIADDEQVIGFVGRFDPDKGISDLLDAFDRVRTKRPRTRLALIGSGFADDRNAELERKIRRTDGAVSIPATMNLAGWYARMDVLAFPSYREGFPNVPLEAACAERPVVGYRSTGVIDAVVDGETGKLVPQRAIQSLADALTAYLENDALRHRDGRAAKERAQSQFARNVVWRAWESYFRDGLAAHARR